MFIHIWGLQCTKHGNELFCDARQLALIVYSFCAKGGGTLSVWEAWEGGIGLIHYDPYIPEMEEMMVALNNVVTPNDIRMLSICLHENSNTTQTNTFVGKTMANPAQTDGPRSMVYISFLLHNTCRPWQTCLFLPVNFISVSQNLNGWHHNPDLEKWKNFHKRHFHGTTLPPKKTCQLKLLKMTNLHVQLPIIWCSSSCPVIQN